MEHHHSVWHLWFHRHAHVIRREGYHSCFPSILPINQEGHLCFLLTSLHVGIKNPVLNWTPFTNGAQGVLGKGHSAGGVPGGRVFPLVLHGKPCNTMSSTSLRK